MYGRHFDDKDELLSHITRQSIDVMKVSQTEVACCSVGATINVLARRSPSGMTYQRKNGSL